MFKTLIASTAIALSLANFARAEAPMAFDVAEDHTRIYMADSPLHENGMPAHGNAFVSQGYIYPEGTLADGTVGVLKTAAPLSPISFWGPGHATDTSSVRVAMRPPASGSSAARPLRSTMAPR